MMAGPNREAQVAVAKRQENAGSDQSCRILEIGYGEEMTKNDSLTRARTAAAVANRRRKQNRLAAELVEAGWKAVPPGEPTLIDLRDMIDHIVEQIEHACPDVPETECAPCVTEKVRTTLQELGILRTPAECGECGR
jgi:hypothetical protein